MEPVPILCDISTSVTESRRDCAEEEAWVAVPGYEGSYEVSSQGRLRRASKSRMAPAGYILKPKISWDGYPEYGLSKHQQYWHVKAHRLVALAFLGPPPFEGAHVAHFDGNKVNNHVSNLRWATPKENEADKKRHGRVPHRAGDRHPCAKLSELAVQQARRDVLAGVLPRIVAERLGVAAITVYEAVVGTTWSTVTDPPALRWERRASRWKSN